MAVTYFIGGPSRTRTCDPLIMSLSISNIYELFETFQFLDIIHFLLCFSGFPCFNSFIRFQALSAAIC
jgi:hypothetical protein